MGRGDGAEVIMTIINVGSLLMKNVPYSSRCAKTPEFGHIAHDTKSIHHSIVCPKLHLFTRILATRMVRSVKELFADFGMMTILQQLSAFLHV